jgi:hypothetical protein
MTTGNRKGAVIRIKLMHACFPVYGTPSMRFGLFLNTPNYRERAKKRGARCSPFQPSIPANDSLPTSKLADS